VEGIGRGGALSEELEERVESGEGRGFGFIRMAMGRDVKDVREARDPDVQGREGLSVLEATSSPQQEGVAPELKASRELCKGVSPIR